MGIRSSQVLGAALHFRETYQLQLQLQLQDSRIAP